MSKRALVLALALVTTFSAADAEAKKKSKKNKSAKIAATAAPATTPAAAPEAKAAPAVVAAPAPAGTVKMVDCLNRDNAKLLPCGTSDAGTVGTGPKFSGGFPSVNHGFINGNQLIVAVDLGSNEDAYGGIFGIDLTTGNRTLLSGKMNDPLQGEVSKGKGASMNSALDVQQGPGGKWIALASVGLTSNRTLVSIDPATGDRTTLLDETDTKCAGIADGTIRLEIGPGIAVAPDGAVYFALNNSPQGSGKGIAKVQNGKCSLVSLSGGADKNNKGSGPTYMGSTFANLTFRDGAVYMLQWNTHPSIIKTDLATGNRSIVSSADKGTGQDLQSGSMAIAPNGTFWTYSAYANSYSGFVAADPLTGNRTIYDPQGSGPDGRVQGSDKGVWVHPDGKHLITQYGQRIHIYDIATGNSNVLSY